MDRIKRFLPLIFLAGVIALIFAMGWNRYLSLDTIRDHGAEFHAFKEANYILCLLILMAVFAILTASVVPGVFFVTITAGYLFGPWVGGFSTSIAATIGAQNCPNSAWKSGLGLVCSSSFSRAPIQQ